MYFTTSLGLMRLIRNSKFCIKWVSYNNRKNVFIANQLGQILTTNKKKNSHQLDQISGKIWNSFRERAGDV